MVKSGGVDFCYSNDVFIHIADIEVVRAYFREVARVLKPGALFRFNVRELVINKKFSNAPGGLFAKAMHLSRLRSGVHAYNPGTEGFNGLKFQRWDIKSHAAACGLSVRRVESAPDPSGGDFLWCDCVKN